MTAALSANDQLQENPFNFIGLPHDSPVRRTVLVTGGTEGTGPAICKRMADLGHFVAATYRNEDKARAWQDRMESEGYLFFIYKCDAANAEGSRDLLKDIADDLGPVQVLINNDLDSVSNVTSAAIDGMLKTGFGRIVNISSIAEAGMHGFTKALAQEVAKSGITVNTISPGYVATDMTMSVPENIRNGIIAQIPVGRLGKPEDVAHVVSFLVSEESGFITGANIAANGGHFMG